MRSLKFLLGLSGAVASWLFVSSLGAGDVRLIAATYSAVAGTMLGFLVAALAILTAVLNRRLMQNMIKTGHYYRLLSELYWASSFFLSTLIISLASLFLNGIYLCGGVSIASGTLSVAVLLLMAAGRKFMLVMEYLR